MHEIREEKKKRKLTKRGAVVDALEGDNGGENENEGQKKSEDEDGMEESPIGQMARWGHLDLGQIQQATTGGTGTGSRSRDGDAPHAGGEAYLHRGAGDGSAAGGAHEEGSREASSIRH